MTTIENNEQAVPKLKRAPGGIGMRRALIFACLLIAVLYGLAAFLRIDPIPDALDTTAGQLELLASIVVEQPNLSASGGLNGLIDALPVSLSARVRSNPNYGFIMYQPRRGSPVPAVSPSAPAADRGLIVAIVKDDSVIRRTHGLDALPMLVLIDLDTLEVKVRDGELLIGDLIQLRNGTAPSDTYEYSRPTPRFSRAWRQLTGPSAEKASL